MFNLSLDIFSARHMTPVLLTCYRMSVRLYVHLSVCHTLHGLRWNGSRYKIYDFHRTVKWSFMFLMTKIHGRRYMFHHEWTSSWHHLLKVGISNFIFGTWKLPLLWDTDKSHIWLILTLISHYAPWLPQFAFYGV